MVFLGLAGEYSDYRVGIRVFLSVVLYEFCLYRCISQQTMDHRGVKRFVIYNNGNWKGNVEVFQRSLSIHVTIRAFARSVSSSGLASVLFLPLSTAG